MASGNSFALLDDEDEDVTTLVAARLGIKKAAEEKATAEATEKAAAEAARRKAELDKKEAEELAKRLQDARARNGNGNGNCNGQKCWVRKGDGPNGEKFPVNPPSVAGSVDGSVDGSKDDLKASGVNVPEQELEPETFTLKEYEKIRDGKRKALHAQKVEQRKVDEEEFQAMQKMSNKKTDDAAFIKLGAEKEKKKVEAKMVLSEKDKEKKEEADKKVKIITDKLLARRSWRETSWRNRGDSGSGEGGARGGFGGRRGDGGGGSRGEIIGVYREGGFSNGARDEDSALKTLPPAGTITATPAVKETAKPPQGAGKSKAPAVPKFENRNDFPQLKQSLSSAQSYSQL